MGHPHWTPDQDMLSNCCGAVSCTEIVDDCAICSKCGEHATFEIEEAPDPLTFDGLTKLLYPNRKLHSITKEKP